MNSPGYGLLLSRALYLSGQTCNNATMQDLPFSSVNLVGDQIIRVVTLSWPEHVLRGFLPPGFELGPQDLTPEGEHPISFYLSQMLGLTLTAPNLLPVMTYNELCVVVPHVYVRGGAGPHERAGPFLYLPRILLDNVWAMTGGLMFYAYPKRLADFTVRDGDYRIRERSGTEILRYDYQAVGTPRPPGDWPLFGPARRMLSMPVVTASPFGVGPVAMCTRYDKLWTRATVQPLHGSLAIASSFIPGMPTGTYPRGEQPASIASSMLGAFDLRCRVRQSVSYPWRFHSQVLAQTAAAERA